MDALEQEIRTLHERVDAMYCMLESLPGCIVDAWAKQQPEHQSQGYGQGGLGSRGGLTPIRHQTMMEHKDVLRDDTYVDDDFKVDKALAPEVQIQRLTAQLTAAYNRIAALEEQLLSKRIYH